MTEQKNTFSMLDEGSQEKIRVLFTAGSLNVGGAERWIVKLIPKLNPDKFECAVATIKPLRPPDDFLLENLQSHNVEVHSLNLKHYQLLFPLGTMRMKKLLRKIRPDVIVTVLFVDRFYAVRAAASLGIPVISSFRGESALAELGMLKKRIYLEHLAASDEIFAVSENTRDFLPEYIREDVSVIHNFVDIKHFAPSRQHSYTGKQEFTLGTAARLEKVKNISAMVEIFAELKKRLPFVNKLLILGEGPEQKEIERIALEMGVSNSVEIVGNQEDVRPWYRQIDFFLSTSTSEGLPNAMLEAMASSIIPIVTNVGGVPEVVADQKNGFLIDPNNVAANIERIEDILAECVRDPARFNKIARNARETIISKFSAEVIVPQYEKLLLRAAYSRDNAE